MRRLSEDSFRAMVLYTRSASFFETLRQFLLLSLCHRLRTRRERHRVLPDIIRVRLPRNHSLFDRR